MSLSIAVLSFSNSCRKHCGLWQSFPINVWQRGLCCFFSLCASVFVVPPTPSAATDSTVVASPFPPFHPYPIPSPTPPNQRFTCAALLLSQWCAPSSLTNSSGLSGCDTLPWVVCWRGRSSPVVSHPHHHPYRVSRLVHWSVKRRRQFFRASPHRLVSHAALGNAKVGRSDTNWCTRQEG